MMDLKAIRLMEEIMANAWPAPKRLIVDGWLLGLAGPLSRRANSVIPLNHGSLPLAEKIEYCCEAYHQLGRTAVFKMTPAAAPSDLDDRLAEAGLKKHEGAIIQLLDRSGFQTRQIRQTRGAAREIRIVPKADEIWLKACSALAGHDKAQALALAGITGSIMPQVGFGLILEQGRPISCGLAVVERGWIGLFDLIVTPTRRRQGLGREIIAALLEWGVGQGGNMAYLQVEPANKPALALYAKLGFEEAYTYWYRQLDPDNS